MLLSIRGIAKELGNNIIIYPFILENLKVMGYNLTSSAFGYSLTTRKPLLKSSVQNSHVFVIAPQDTVCVLTNEIVWVSKSIAGTIHSKVDRVSEGLSHISTTLDPNWIGHLLITFKNNLDRPHYLKIGESFATVLFHGLKNPAQYNHNNPPFREDRLERNCIDYSDLKEAWLNDKQENRHRIDLPTLKKVVIKAGCYQKLWKRIKQNHPRLKFPTISEVYWYIPFATIPLVIAVYLIYQLQKYRLITPAALPQYFMVFSASFSLLISAIGVILGINKYRKLK